MDWVAVVAAIAAVASAVVAVVQALQARSARADAAAAEVRAREQADRSFAQADRAAAAQESIADAVRRVGQRPEPWEVSHFTTGTFKLKNAGGRRVISTRAEIVDGRRAPAGRALGTWLMSEPMVWAKGAVEPVEVTIDARLTLPASAWLNIFWREVDDPVDTPDQEWSQQLQ